MRYSNMEIVVPTSLADITLGQYKEYVALPEELNDVAKMDQAIRIFCNLSASNVEKLPLKARKKIADKITLAVSEQPSDVILRTSLDGLALGFHTNLDGMTLGEYVDLETAQDSEQSWDKIMQILYRPVISEQGKRYEILPYGETQEVELDYNKMTMDVVFSAMVFFCDLGIDLLAHTMKSLMDKHRKVIENSSSPKSGDGMDQLLPLLTATYYELKKLRDSLYIQPLCT